MRATARSKNPGRSACKQMRLLRRGRVVDSTVAALLSEKPMRSPQPGAAPREGAQPGTRRHRPIRRPAPLATAIAAGLFLVACGGADQAWFQNRIADSGIDFVHDSGYREKRLMPEMTTGGGALFDMDGDGDLDVYLVQGGPIEVSEAERPPNQLYRNLGGGRFENASAGSGTEDRGVGQGAAVGDVDNDGDPDLYVTNLGPDRLLINEGGGRFRDGTEAAGLGQDGWGTSASFLDFDRDGWLDLFVAQYLVWSPDKEVACINNFGTPDYCSPLNYGAPAGSLLLRNRGQGRFADVSQQAGITSFGTALGVVTGDFDMDGWPDLFVANDGMANRLWINQQDGRFVDKAVAYSCAIDNDAAAKAGMGTTAEDVDDDGDLDLIVCNLVNETDSFFQNEDGQYFVDRTREQKLYASASRTFTRFGVGMQDFDNDGRLDIYQANGRVKAEEQAWAEDLYAEPNVLLRGLPDGGYEEVLPRGGTAELLALQSRAAVFGDLDDDGGMDVLVVNRGARPSLLFNRKAGRGAWAGFRVLEASGRDALGATLRLKVGPRRVRREVRSGYSYLAANDPRVHVGLGDLSRVEEVTVQWADGKIEAFGDFAAGSYHSLRRGEGQGEGEAP